MLAATFVFLGLAVLTVLSLIFPDSDGIRSCEPAVSQKEGWSKNATWYEIKNLYEDRLSLIEKNSQKQRGKLACSWSRTFALCAILCIIGVLLEAEFDERISIVQMLKDVFQPYWQQILAMWR